MSLVLGISGSPVENSNTDRLIKTIMDATETEFFKLSDLNVNPCRACKKCVYTNKCAQDDDFKWLSKKVLDADALIIGTPVMYGSASGFTKAFLERLWSLRHIKLLRQGKIGANVVVGWSFTEEVSRWLNYVMMIEGMDVAGSVIGHGSPACFTCGPGKTCSHSLWNATQKLEKMTGQKFGLENIYRGYLEELPDNDPINNSSYRILNCISVEDQPK